MECTDKNCPTHGTLATRGAVLEGTVVSDKMQGTVIVERGRLVRVRKYDRYKKARSRIPAHNPPCIGAKVGDQVRIVECRKLSKTVSFVVTEKLGSKEAEKKEEPKKKAKKKVKKKAKPKKKEVEDG